MADHEMPDTASKWTHQTGMEAFASFDKRYHKPLVGRLERGLRVSSSRAEELYAEILAKLIVKGGDPLWERWRGDGRFRAYLCTTFTRAAGEILKKEHPAHLVRLPPEEMEAIADQLSDDFVDLVDLGDQLASFFDGVQADLDERRNDFKPYEWAFVTRFWNLVAWIMAGGCPDPDEVFEEVLANESPLLQEKYSSEATRRRHALYVKAKLYELVKPRLVDLDPRVAEAFDRLWRRRVQRRDDR